MDVLVNEDTKEFILWVDVSIKQLSTRGISKVQYCECCVYGGVWGGGVVWCVWWCVGWWCGMACGVVSGVWCNVWCVM